MIRPVMCLKKLGVRALVTPLFFSLSLGPVPVAFGGASPTPSSIIATSTYTVKDYSQSKLPSISSCDAKAKDSDTTTDLPSSGNSYIDSVTSTATKLNKAYGSGAKKSTDDTESNDDDIDGNATLDTDCEATKDKVASTKLGIDADKLACPLPAKPTLDELLEKKDASQKYLACKRGVLDALKGEIGCFKKQIADANGYMNEVVNGPGGLAEILNQGNNDLQSIDQEIQDRQSQYSSANERIEGGEGGNPPGLKQAKQALTELTTKLPSRVTQVNQQVQNLRSQQARFETLVSQLSMARAMECMNTPMQGYRCVKDGTTSTKYPSGSVSPVDYLKCIYAQSANKVAGGTMVRNAPREDAYMKQATAAFAQAAGKAPSATTLPDFSDSKAFSATMKVYTVNNPADLLKLLSPTLKDMQGATGKNMTAQFQADINRCYSTAQKEVATERTDANSPIKASEVAMQQSFDTTKAANAGAFRELRDSYATAIKAATGQSVNIDTSKCETASLEDQAKCFDALNSMSDALLTGKVNPTSSSLTGPAQALTNGQEPIHKFAAVLMAKNVTNRTIPVACSGVDECLTKYTGLRTQLKQTVDERKAFKETYKTQVNNKLMTTAKDLASKGVTGAGAAGIQTSGITLNSVAAGVEKRKTQLATAMSKLGVDAGLDLDPKEIKEPGKDDATGLFKPSDLKSLVMAEVTPQLPDMNSKGFTDALKSIGERDKEVEKLEDALDTDMAAYQSKAAECAATKKKASCDKATEVLKDCKETASKNNLAVLDADIASVTAKLNTINSNTKRTDSDTKEANTLNEKIAKDNSDKASFTTASFCGIESTHMDTYCEYGDAVTDNKDKGNQATGQNKSGNSNTSTNANGSVKK
jgi:hypothetical protein